MRVYNCRFDRAYLSPSFGDAMGEMVLEFRGVSLQRTRCQVPRCDAELLFLLGPDFVDAS